VKVERLVSERVVEGKELVLMRSRVEELEAEQKSHHETTVQLTAQREQLQKLCSQHSDDVNMLKLVSDCFDCCCCHFCGFCYQLAPISAVFTLK